MPKFCACARTSHHQGIVSYVDHYNAPLLCSNQINRLPSRQGAAASRSDQCSVSILLAGWYMPLFPGFCLQSVEGRTTGMRYPCEHGGCTHSKIWRPTFIVYMADVYTQCLRLLALAIMQTSAAAKRKMPLFCFYIRSGSASVCALPCGRQRVAAAPSAAHFGTLVADRQGHVWLCLFTAQVVN